MMCNNSNLDHVNINAYTKFGKMLSVCSEDIEWKQGKFDEFISPDKGLFERNM